MRYRYLLAFDKAMINLQLEHNVFGATNQYIHLKHNSDKVVVFEKSDLLFIFNFHP